MQFAARMLAQLLLKKADGAGRIAVNEILIANAAAAAMIREGATQKLQDDDSGRAPGNAIHGRRHPALLQKGIVSPHEAFMKRSRRIRFKQHLPAEEAALGNAAGSVPDDEPKLPGNFVKQQRRA